MKRILIAVIVGACVVAGLVPAAVAEPGPGSPTAAGPTTHSRWDPANRKPHATTAARPDAARRAVPLGSGPQLFAIAAGTAYVTSDEGTISVVDVRNCNADRVASCQAPIAQIAGRVGGIGVATYANTLYVGSFTDETDGAVSVYDITHCRTGDVSGCGPARATIPLADGPFGLATDPATGTLYVGNYADHVDVLAVRTCRANVLTGCAHAVVGSIPATDGPLFPLVDSTRRTLYVPANGPSADGSGTGVHVVDLRHCAAGDTSACAAPVATMTAGLGAIVAYENTTTKTLYVENQNADSVSVLDVRRCTGANTTGCGAALADVPVGATPNSSLAETDDGRIYVANNDSDTLSTFDTARCRASDTSGCPTSPVPTVRANGEPFWIAYDPASDTVFTVQHVTQTLQVFDGDVCSGGSGAGCRNLLPSVPGDLQQFVDQDVHTWYGVDEAGNLTLTDSRICTAAQADRCAAAAVHTSEPNASASRMVADDSTHSLFMFRTNPRSGRSAVVVLDTRTCNAAVHTRCSPVAPPLRLPNSFAAVMALDAATHTVYVTTQDDSSLQVIDGQNCNAVRQTACSAPVGSVALGGRVYGVAVDSATKTVYVSEFGDDFDSNVVYVLGTARCRAGDVSGCGKPVKRFRTGPAPLGLVDDPAHHTLFVLANGEGPNGSRVQVFDTSTCNARSVAGCGPVAAVPTGRAPFLAALDPTTGNLFVVDFLHASLTVVDAGHCNAVVTDRCTARQFDVGDSPARVAVDPATHSVFVRTVGHDQTYYLDSRVR